MQPKPARADGAVIKATRDVIGKEVKNPEGEYVGTIQEIMIDFPAARVTYAIMTLGGFLGMGNKLFAVPWVSLTCDLSGDHFVLNVDKRLLDKAPGFDKDNWPDMSDPTRLSEIYKYYGSSPYWE